MPFQIGEGAVLGLPLSHTKVNPNLADEAYNKVKAKVTPKELEDILVSSPDTLSGAVRFANTRVPVQALIDTLDDGDGLTEFLEGWRNVSREHAEAVIHWQQNVARQTFGLEISAP